MKFALTPVREAEGTVLGHSVQVSGETLKKGRKLTAADLERIAAAGIGQVYSAHIGADDVAEDEAADRIAAAMTAVMATQPVAVD